jgi:hypothetical protein
MKRWFFRLVALGIVAVVGYAVYSWITREDEFATQVESRPISTAA